MSSMKIHLNIEGAATLDDSATARDFAALLPLRLKLDDYAATETISDLSKHLSTPGAPAGFEPSAGDLTYYSPWGTWPSSTRISAIRRDSSSSDASMTTSRR
jgi:hypothetical protein